MIRYAATRLLASVPLLVAISILCFALLHLAPGGPIASGDPRQRAADRARLERVFGLDAPLPVQYVRWLGRVVRGDLGESLVTGEPVARMIASRLPATLELMGIALAVSMLLGIGLGTLAAWHRGTWIDHACTATAVVGVSVPVFWLAIVAIALFAAHWGWLPPGGRATLGGAGSFVDHLRHLVLPVGVLVAVQTPAWSRVARASVLDVTQEDWLRAARARGLAPWRIMARHALRPALAPLVTVLGLQVPVLLTGAAITETLFAWPGLGRLFYEGAQRYDYPRLMGILVVAAMLVVVGNLAADLVCARLDPRIRLQRAR
jgi:peptide/nickel transport system permease protein